MPTLHSVNALRVMAEYFVVRYHIFAGSVGMDMFVGDLMSFFFVLSGFVMMHTHYTDSFVTVEQKLDFWIGRWKKIFPAFILNMSFYIPTLIISAVYGTTKCPLDFYCPLMQIFLLSGWAGCGVYHTVNALNWYLITLAWLWWGFPFLHAALCTWFVKFVWIKILSINILSTGILYFFSGYNIFTICAVPVLRLGEFIIGCAVACLLKQTNIGSFSVNTWTPVAVIFLIYICCIYTLLALPHDMPWLCMNEERIDVLCRLWHKSEWTEKQPPCMIVWDKYFNKHAILWAAVIYTTASAERENNIIMKVLGHDIFKTLSSFSLSLYLGHTSVSNALSMLTDAIGWFNFWHEDALLIVVYLLCYVLHLLTNRLSSLLFKPRYEFTQVASPVHSELQSEASCCAFVNEETRTSPETV
jgi:peptidoglycan/LPS O-acetylase OafA/YrhL